MPVVSVVSWGGSSVAVEGPPEDVARVREQLPPFYGAGTEAPVTAVLERTGDEVALHLEGGLDLRMPAGPELYRAAASRIELALVDRLPALVAVHAAVVSDGRGVIVLPGRSMAGKSTLTRALLAAGCTYWSDEFALVDEQGYVHAYPRAMTLRTPSGSQRHLPERRAGTEELGAARLVGLLRYDETGWDATDLTPGQAAVGLLDNCVSVRRDPNRALAALTQLATAARTVTGTRGEADEAARRLLET